MTMSRVPVRMTASLGTSTAGVAIAPVDGFGPPEKTPHPAVEQPQLATEAGIGGLSLDEALLDLDGPCVVLHGGGQVPRLRQHLADGPPFDAELLGRVYVGPTLPAAEAGGVVDALEVGREAERSDAL